MRRLMGVSVATLVLAGATVAAAQAPPSCRWASDPATTADAILFGVAVSDSTPDAWAVGSVYGSRGRERTLVRHWDGSQWARQPSPNVRDQSNRLQDVAIAPDGTVWAVGSRSGGLTMKTLVQRYNGDAWRMRRSLSPSKELNVLDAVDVAPGGDVYAAGSRWNAKRQYRMMIHHYDGTSWELVPNRLPGRLLDLDVLSDTEAWAVGTKTSGRESHMVALHYDGTSWTETALPDLEGSFSILEGVSAVAPNDVWAAGAYAASGELRPVIVHYDGTQWSLADLPELDAGVHLFDVAAAGGLAVAVGQHEDYEFGEDSRVVLEWNGTEWSAAPQDDGVGSNWLFAVDLAADGRAWAVGYHSTRPQTSYVERRTCD